MRVQDYKKKVESFDHLTDNKSVEAVEEMVKYNILFISKNKKQFWRNIAFSPPLYGADIKGSLFDDGVAWDLKNLPGILK